MYLLMFCPSFAALPDATYTSLDPQSHRHRVSGVSIGDIGKRNLRRAEKAVVENLISCSVLVYTVCISLASARKLRSVQVAGDILGTWSSTSPQKASSTALSN